MKLVTTIEHIGGVGVNGRYRVKRDGKLVAVIRRTGQRNHWGLYSIHYDHRLGHAGSVDGVKAVAMEWESYPDANEVYEIICQSVEPLRRSWVQKHRAAELAEAAADLAAGSNTAHDRLVELAKQIDAFAKDRTDIGNQQWAHHGLSYHGTEPNYPKPPEEKAA